MAGPIHYELLVRKTAASAWSLFLATESRAQALETAEDLLTDKQAVSVRITKEVLTPETGEYSSIVILTKGLPEPKKRRATAGVSANDAGRSTPGPAVRAGLQCLSPRDVYTAHGRRSVARLFGAWLSRHQVTAYELLHRADLAQKLEASGVELQHAIQKLAVPESQSSDQTVHELIRHYQKLADQLVARLVDADHKGQFPVLTAQTVVDVANRLADRPDRGFIFGGALAQYLRDVTGGHARLQVLLDLMDQAPAEGAARNLILGQVDQVLCEILDHRPTLASVLGSSLDEGAMLCVVVRILARREVAALIRHDANLALVVPPIDGMAARLGERISSGDLPTLAGSLMALVEHDLKSPRRLRPTDPSGEIEVLRALAMMLTTASDQLLSLDEIQAAFSERSKVLVSAEFVDSFTAQCRSPLEEAERLTRLCENVTGVANKRSAARWLSACVGSLRFETVLRRRSDPGGASPAQRLVALARLQQSVRAAALSDSDTVDICGQVGRLGGLIEAEAQLVQGLAKASAPVVARLGALLRMASGETAPLGPAAEMARKEAVKLMRQPQARSDLATDPAGLGTLKPLLISAGLAA